MMDPVKQGSCFYLMMEVERAFKTFCFIIKYEKVYQLYSPSWGSLVGLLAAGWTAERLEFESL
jgi:hypothetical protein